MIMQLTLKESKHTPPVIAKSFRVERLKLKRCFRKLCGNLLEDITQGDCFAAAVCIRLKIYSGGSQRRDEDTHWQLQRREVGGL